MSNIRSYRERSRFQGKIVNPITAALKTGGRRVVFAGSDMFTFTKRADYALLALSYLTIAASHEPQRLVNTKEIAEKFHIPIELLAKILQTLARHELIASFPGPTGGYRLTRPPDRISVADVVRIVDGQVGIVHCSNGNEVGCEQYERCTIRSPLSVIESRMYRLLEQMSIQEVSQEQFSEREDPNFIPISNLLRQ